MASQGQQVLGDYLLIELVGEGGMAEVYRARPIKDRAGQGHAGRGKPRAAEGGEEVVIKRIKPGLFNQPEFPIFREMFLNEAKLVRGLSHPNLARMHTLGEGHDQSLGIKVPFIVGEYIHGHQLWKLLRIATSGFTGRNVPPDIAAYIIREAARGLGHAHAHQDPKTGRPLPIIHRDVAPDNIMISNDGQVKVIDFGVAKAVGGFGPQTQTGIIKGKLAYLAPEQVAQKVMPATDVFGAGIILHEMLTGRRLFGGANDFVVISRVLKAEIPPPSQFVIGIPPELEEVVMTALSRNLSVRYANGNELAAALTECMQRVPALRGLDKQHLRRWKEELLAEAAFRAEGDGGAVESSSSELKAVEHEPREEAALSGEIELSGEDVIMAEMADADPAIREVVTQGLKVLNLEMLQGHTEPTQPLPKPGLAEVTAPLRIPSTNIDSAEKTHDKLRPVSLRRSSRERAAVKPRLGATAIAALAGLIFVFVLSVVLLLLR